MSSNIRKTIYSSPTGHTVTAIKAEKVANGAIAVHLRCCDDPTSDHPHTLYHMQVVKQSDGSNVVVHGLDQTSIDQKLQSVAAEVVAPQHESIQAAHAYLMSLVGIEEPTPKTTMTLKD